MLPGVLVLVLFGMSLTIGSPHGAARTTAGGSSPTVRTLHVRTVDASTTTPSGTLAVSASTVTQGSTITFTYTATPATSKNWIGIYPPGDTPGKVSSTAYKYAPDATGTVSFSTGSLAPGGWTAYLLYDTGYEVMAGPITFTVTAATTAPSGTIAESAKTLVQGSIITITYTATPATSDNWIGIYQPGQTPGHVGSTIWQYTPDASGTASFSTASLTPGTWVAYLFYDTGYEVMAGPITFTVTAPPSPPPTTMPTYTGELGHRVLNGPFGIALDGHGDVWVAEAYADQVAELSPSGDVERVIGSEGSGPGQLDDPEAVAVDDGGQVFVADTGNDRVEEFSTVTGAYVGEITKGMSAPQGLALDGSGDLWVAQNGIYTNSADSVTEYSATGDELFSIGANTSKFGGMSNPADVAVNSAGDVYVTEPDYDLVQEFTQYGQYLGEFGTPVDGTTGTLDFPVGLVIEPNGQVLVADSGNNRIASFGLAP